MGIFDRTILSVVLLVFFLFLVLDVFLIFFKCINKSELLP